MQLVEHETLLRGEGSPIERSRSTLSLPHDDRLWRARSPGFNHATSPMRSLSAVREFKDI